MPIKASCLPLIFALFLSPVTVTRAENQSTVLKGQIVKMDVTLNDLRDARLALSRARKATANLFDEVTRQQVTFNYSPNVIGSTVISTPMPTLNGHYLPARSKWVKASMEELKPIIDLLKQDIDQAIETDRRTEVREDMRRSLDLLRDKAISSVKTVFEIYKDLEKQTSAASLDNSEIASTAEKLDYEIKRLDGQFKLCITFLQRESKISKKNLG